MIKELKSIQYRLDGDCLELTPIGEIDHHNASKMRAEADALINKYSPQRVALNLGKIDFMDSSGLGFIMGRYKLVVEKGGSLFIKTPSKSVLKICRLAGLERIVKIIT